MTEDQTGTGQMDVAAPTQPAAAPTHAVEWCAMTTTRARLIPAAAVPASSPR